MPGSAFAVLFVVVLCLSPLFLVCGSIHAYLQGYMHERAGALRRQSCGIPGSYSP